MCGFGVRREILEVVSIYFSHSVTHAEWQDQIRFGYLLCFVMGIWDGLFCAVFSPSPWATFIKPGGGKFADNHLFVRKIFIWRNKFYVEISSHVGWCSSGNGRVSACPENYLFPWNPFEGISHRVWSLPLFFPLLVNKGSCSHVQLWLQLQGNPYSLLI